LSVFEEKSEYKASSSLDLPLLQVMWQCNLTRALRIPLLTAIAEDGAAQTIDKQTVPNDS